MGVSHYTKLVRLEAMLHEIKKTGKLKIRTDAGKDVTEEMLDVFIESIRKEIAENNKL